MGREIIYLSRRCHHQNDSCITMGSDENHFNVSLIVRDKVARQCPQTTTYFLKRKESRRGIQPTPFSQRTESYTNSNPSSTTPTLYERKFKRNKQNLIKTKSWRLKKERERKREREGEREKENSLERERDWTGWFIVYEQYCSLQ